MRMHYEMRATPVERDSLSIFRMRCHFVWSGFRYILLQKKMGKICLRVSWLVLLRWQSTRTCENVNILYTFYRYGIAPRTLHLWRLPTTSARRIHNCMCSACKQLASPFSRKYLCFMWQNDKVGNKVLPNVSKVRLFILCAALPMNPIKFISHSVLFASECVCGRSSWISSFIKTKWYLVVLHDPVISLSLHKLQLTINRHQLCVE